MNTRVAIGNKIAEIRNQKKMSQQELADLTGLTQNNISRIEQGKYSFGIDILFRIVDVLGKNVEIV
ncbi:MAG: helix-turn-helix transcriptional regulator [Paludibacter sp.]|nr:helix-turn-helix transcriptional regulator [Paludibacter sp.]